MIQRGIGGSEPIRPDGQPVEAQEERRTQRSLVVATGTLACPECDAPIALHGASVGPASPLRCPYCGHAGAVRDFLSLAEPTRPTRVEVRIVRRFSPTISAL